MTRNSDHSHDEPLDDGTVANAWSIATAHAEHADWLDDTSVDLIATFDPRLVAIGYRAHREAPYHRTLAAAALAVGGFGDDADAHAGFGLPWLSEHPSATS
jgi:hypothetical protein